MSHSRPLRDAFARAHHKVRNENVPVVSCIVEFTGFGKTFESANIVVEQFVTHQQIGIYTAPTRRLVDDYAVMVREAAKIKYPELYIYRLYALESTLDDDFISQDLLRFVETAEQHLFILGKRKRTGLAATIEENLSVLLKRLPQHIRNYEMIKSQLMGDIGDTRLAEDLVRYRQRVRNLSNQISRGIIRHELLTNHSKHLYYVPEIRVVLERFTPLDLFIKDPGVILATASKLATGASNIYLREKRDGTMACGDNRKPTFFHWFASMPYRCTLYVDEEEESHQFLYRALKKQLTNRDVDLHRIIYAHFHHYDITFCYRYAHDITIAFGRKLFFAIEDIQRDLDKICAAFTTPQTLGGPTRFDLCRKLTCFAAFSDGEVHLLVNDFFAKQNLGDHLTALNEKFRMLLAIRCFLAERRLQRGMQAGDVFDDYCHAINSLYDKKRILASKQTMRQFSDYLGYIFFNERLELYEAEILNQIYVQPVIGSNNIELITREKLQDPNAYTMREFLNFLLLLTRRLLKTTVAASSDSRKITDRQDQVLINYKKKIGGWGLAVAVDEGSGHVCEPDELETSPGSIAAEWGNTDDSDTNPGLTEEYVFKGSKFVLSIVEERPIHQEYSTDLCYVSIVGNVQQQSPEELLLKFLRVNDDSDLPKNLAFLMSATGQVSQHWGAFVYRYLDQKIEADRGSILGPSDSQMQAMASLRQQRLGRRHIEIRDFCRTDFQQALRCGPLFLDLMQEARQQLAGEDFRLRNPYKLDEVCYMLAMLDRLCTGPIRSAMVFSQRIGFMVQVLSNMTDKGIACTRGPVPGLFYFDPSTFGIKTDPVTVIAYSSAFGKAAGSGAIIDGRFVPYANLDDYTEESDVDLLEHLLDERQAKILFLSAYQSASRGLTLTNKCDPNRGVPHPRYRNAGRKDFDALMLAMSPFYDGLYRVPDPSVNQMERLQAMLQYLWSNNRLEATTFAQLPVIISEEHEIAFHPEYLRFMGRSTMQTLGRAERVRSDQIGAPDRQEIYINREVVLEQAQFFKLVPGLEQRFSANNWVMFQHIQEFEANTRMFASERAWDEYAKRELEHDDAFTRASRALYRGFRNPEKRALWQALRSPKLFSDEWEYIDSLRQRKPDMLGWAAFVEALFLPRPLEEVFIRQEQLAGSSTKPVRIISDLYHANRGRYDPARLLVPPALQGIPEFKEALRQLSINPDLVFRQAIPRPKFFFDYVKGYLTELVFAQMVATDKRIKILDIASHPYAADLFERFDHYLLRGDKIIAIDNKSWGRVSDRKLSKELQNKLLRKISLIEPHVGEVEPVYVNLYGEKTYGIEFYGGRLVRFYNMFVQFLDSEGVTRMAVNYDLFDYLRGDGH